MIAPPVLRKLDGVGGKSEHPLYSNIQMRNDVANSNREKVMPVRDWLGGFALSPTGLRKPRESFWETQESQRSRLVGNHKKDATETMIPAYCASHGRVQ